MAQPARAKVKIKKAAEVADATVYIDKQGKFSPVMIDNNGTIQFDVTFPDNFNGCEIKCIATFKKSKKEDDYTVSLSSS